MGSYERFQERFKKYKSDLAEYELKRIDFDKKIKDGQKKAKELNRRFAEWYYVIPGGSYPCNTRKIWLSF